MKIYSFDETSEEIHSDLEISFEEVFQNSVQYTNCSSAIKSYMNSQKGATGKIVAVLEEVLNTSFLN